MNDIEIKELIKKLRSQKNYDEAYLGYFEFGGGPEESFIKANRQGLELHIAELLEATLKSKEDFEKGEKKSTFGLNHLIVDEDSDSFFCYIKLVNETKNNIKPLEDEETWNEKMIRFCFFGVFIVLILLILIGLVTVISWI